MTDAPQWAVCGLPSEAHPRQPLLGRGSEINQFIEAILEVFSDSAVISTALFDPVLGGHGQLALRRELAHLRNGYLHDDEKLMRWPIVTPVTASSRPPTVITASTRPSASSITL